MILNFFLQVCNTTDSRNLVLSWLLCLHDIACFGLSGILNARVAVYQLQTTNFVFFVNQKFFSVNAFRKLKKKY